MVARGVPAEAVMAVVTALDFTKTSNWWRDINNSPLWQDRIFHLLAILYGIVAAIALVCFLPFSFVRVLFQSNFIDFLFLWILGSTC